MIDFDIIMIVPRLALTVPNLDEANATLNQSASDQNLSSLNTVAVHVANMLWFAADIKRVGRFRLHSERQFERLNSRFQLGISGTLFQMLLIETSKKLKLCRLFRPIDAVVADILNQLFDLGMLRVDVVSLENTGEKSTLPVL